jgi:hypothetical protein
VFTSSSENIKSVIRSTIAGSVDICVRNLPNDSGRAINRPFEKYPRLRHVQRCVELLGATQKAIEEVVVVQLVSSSLFN